MKNCWRPILLALSITAVTAAIVALAVIYSGTINVAATVPHFAPTKWLLITALDRSVKKHSAEIVLPPAPGDEEIIHAFRHFDEMCVMCHGAPGVEKSDAGKGLNPAPPDLEKAVPELIEKELFWIVKNGIRMTGMPAFGKTHSDRDIRSIVALLKKLPSMTPESYRQYRETAKKNGDHSHSHSH